MFTPKSYAWAKANGPLVCLSHFCCLMTEVNRMMGFKPPVEYQGLPETGAALGGGHSTQMLLALYFTPCTTPCLQGYVFPRLLSH